MRVHLGVGLLLHGLLVAGELSIPDPHLEMIQTYCVDCHDEGRAKGGVNLDLEGVDWSLPENRELWERVLLANEQRLMPPSDEEQPTASEREALMKWLEGNLHTYTPIGGALPRRLSRGEYESTVQSLFGMPEFRLPAGFPIDSVIHGFDNQGEGLVMSPPLLEAYREVATEVADQIFPPVRETVQSTVRTALPDDMVISFAAASLQDKTLRLASRSEDTMRSCTWPSRIEITRSGVYRISVSASTYRQKSKEPMVLELRAREVAASDRTNVQKFRLLKTVEVGFEKPAVFNFEEELYEGQTLLLRWKNAEMTHQADELMVQMKEWFERDQRFLAAWQHAVFPSGDIRRSNTTRLRGANGWNIVRGHWEDQRISLREATMDSKMTKRLLELFNSNQGTFNLADALCFYYHENGPSMEIHGVQVEGPLREVEGPKEKRVEALQKRLMGERKEGSSDEEYARSMLDRFLPKVFRGPVDTKLVEGYLGLAKEHWEAGHTFDEGMHLILRNILISPRFLYRALKPGRMNDHDLAARLSYFLRQAPPDARLMDVANRGRLSDPKVLMMEARRLMPKKASDRMVRSFVGQWLGVKYLPEIMPDPKFSFSATEVGMARSEVEHFFVEMLKKNRPMKDFIDPDFSYTTLHFAERNYKMPLAWRKSAAAQGKKNRLRIQKFEVERGWRHGGLLGQAGVMMATANGVDTQPVLRGVWVLENILGRPTPEPPKDVPALTPDTRGATTPRELLAAHTKEVSCAACHQHIDPLGFVLENFDPVGRWRTEWPGSGKVIDAKGVLPDGTELADVEDLKKWLIGNIDLFSECLSEKLLMYATGRMPNFAERKEIEEIVRKNREEGDGFQDLLLGLIASETFRTK